VLLTDEVGAMLTESKKQHLELLDEYEKERRERIDDYMMTTGIPDILKPMVIKGDLKGTLCNSSFSACTINELTGFVMSASKAIAEMRKELTDALDVVLTKQRYSVNEYYDTMILSNKVISGNLHAIQNNKDVQDGILRKMKIEPLKLTPLKEESKSLDKLFKK
jgi:hypothetical protein